jgi:hypothetical protein
LVEYKAFLNKFLSDIKQDSEHDKLALFIGSGVSRNSGMPSWESVVGEFAKDLGIEQFTTDDYLDIPEKYYNKFGRLEYNKKLFLLLNISPQNVDIQKKLYNLNPSHIITTNWDELIEYASNEVENSEYSVVSNDNELSKTDNSKLIIKMHGSITNIFNDENAIVMKYSDYLNYFKNFPLIDIYVKSIFSTKRVMFLGYSLSDKNVQDIMEYVKQRTNHHIYPYFVTFGKYNQSEFENYKKQGIFVVYLEELTEDLPNDESKYFQAYIQLFEKINNFSENKVENRIYKLLNYYKGINFISPNIAIRVINNIFDLDLSYGLYGDNCLYLDDSLDNNKDVRLFKLFVKRIDKKRLSSIEIRLLEFLNRINISCIQTGIHSFSKVNLVSAFDKYLKVDHSFDYFDAILHFDYEAILSHCNQNLQLNLNIEESIGYKLQKVFMLYKLEDYEGAFILLTEIKQLSFKHKLYFFNGVAKIAISNLCKLNYYKTHKDNEQCKNFDITNELKNIPSKYLDTAFKELLNFEYFYKEYFAIQKLVDKNIKTKNMFDMGGSSGNNDHLELYHRVFNIFLTINFNYLPIEHFNEIRNIYSKSFQALVLNYSILELSEKERKNKFYFSAQKLKSFNILIFHIAIKSFDYKELNLFLTNTLKTNKLIFNDVEKILNRTLVNVSKIEDEYLFCNAIVILSHTHLNMYSSYKILKQLMMKLKVSHNFIIYEIINVFIVNQNNNLNSKPLLITIDVLLEIFMDKFICRNFSVADKESIRSNFFANLLNTLINYKYKTKIKQEKINIFLNYVDKKYHSNYILGFEKIGITFDIKIGETI